uniref:Nucleoside 2-deoxyribosyltransferase n=1 Tax=uncultured prokaryote TaxID=198431 RepID=H5SCL9_9ZZZZ|nr:hypothetical protein HGMM_F11C09C13 [uncultured prokaryote]
MRVYVACPLTLYAPDHAYRRLLARVRRLFPGAEIVSPREMFTNTRDWLQRWPTLLSTLDALVVIPDGDRVGLGVLREVTDALFVGIPIYVYQGSFQPLDAFCFSLDVDTEPSRAVILKGEKE